MVPLPPLPQSNFYLKNRTTDSLNEKQVAPNNTITYFILKNGAIDRDRTCDLLVTNELLYQLSYNGNTRIIT